ncbi:hybrid sensor histidine kinase/response regulator [Paludisphaera rhizosphaerae]|uniref:hybrid sensor histidine kinase/response regulator n=1 Tax=Paludisphaera rhizosphaerae TaxID=2711216 RepID=UPI0013EC5A96|nr:PAS domain S-box protein [Paludisphaera rhizosphaerae]
MQSSAPQIAAEGDVRQTPLWNSRLVGLDLVDADGRWIDVNARLCEILGRSRHDLIGRAVEDFTHPEDAEAERAQILRLRDGTQASYRMRKRLFRADGKWTMVEIESSGVDSGGPARRTSLIHPIAGPSPADETSQYRALLAQSPIGVVVIDPKTERFLDFNDAACESLGYTRAEFGSLTLGDVYVETDPEAIRRRLSAVLTNGRGRFEGVQRTKSGDLRQIAVHSRRIRSGGLAAVQSVWQDVTPPRGPMEVRSRHAALFRQILHSVPLPMGVVELTESDDDVLHVFDNPATCRSFGLAAGATDGLWDGKDLGVPPATMKAWISAYRASQRLGRPVHFEDHQEDENGRRWQGVVVTHMGPGAGGRDRFFYVAEDITERKRAEEEILRLNRSLVRQAAELQTVLDVLPIGVGIAEDPQCRSIRANPTLSAMLRTPVGENVSLSAPDSERPTNFKPFQDGRELTPEELPMQTSARTGIGLRNVEVDVIFDDGREIHLRESVEPLFDEQGATRGCVAVFLDITEQRRAEREREQLLEDLRDADRRKDEFLAMLAHELRSPISAASNAAQILCMKAPDDPDLRWCGDVVDRQTRQLSRLLDDLLDVSRIRRGKITLRREEIDLRAVVERSVETARPSVDARRHRIEIHLPDEPLTVVADPARIEQVLVNLVANAAKYSEEGRTITVSAVADGDQSVVQVHDQGVGMTPEVLARVFDPFAQAETSIDRSQGGLGVGLTIARSLVRLHGGDLTATSDGPGQGSTMTVQLPLAQARAVRQSQPPPTGEGRGVKRRILVVDDNTDAACSLAKLLESAGHEVETAFDGPSGLDVAARFQPDAAILDIGLPGMDGYTLAGRLRELAEGPSLFLIALTGYGSEHDRRRALAEGFDRHMIKPASVDALLSELASVRSRP